MEKAIIGDILKKRIKEKGYTQEAFSEEVGIGHSTLKKYLSGETAYTYEQMEKFAEKLDCSYDYLLGLSKSPIKEYHEITEQTRLSEKAIEKIIKYAKYYDEEFEGKRFIKCLDMLLCEDGAFNAICDFMIASKYVNGIYQQGMDWGIEQLNRNSVFSKMGIQDDKRLSLESQQMINIVSMLKDIKNKMTPEFIAEIKALDTPEFYEKEKLEIEENIRKLSES